MKKLLLLSALLIFACSSDDSNDNSNQTFLERYDGVWWFYELELMPDETPPPPNKIRFNNDALNWCTYRSPFSGINTNCVNVAEV